MKDNKKISKALKLLSKAINKYADALPQPEFEKGGVDFGVAGGDRTEYIVLKDGKLAIGKIPKPDERLIESIQILNLTKPIENMKLKNIADILNNDRHISELSLDELKEINGKIEYEICKKSRDERDEEVGKLVDYYANLMKWSFITKKQRTHICRELEYKLEEL